MPLYEGIGIVAEKHTVILDIGHAFTKCGFAREAGPRWIIPSQVKNSHTGKLSNLWDFKDRQELYFILKEFLHMLYFKYLVVNPKDRRVVIVESILCQTDFREVLAKVLFCHFEVPSILFVPSHLMSLFTLGISSAVVLDSGYSETIVLPIYEGVVILNAWQALPVAAQAIHRRIEAEVMEKAKVKTLALEPKPLGELLSEPLEETVLEDIKVRTCFVAPFELGQKIQVYENGKRLLELKLSEEVPEPPPSPPDVEYPLNGEKIMTIPGEIRSYAPEIMFERSGDEQSIASLILDAILKSPIDVRTTLAENLVIMGGNTMLPGFKHRLLAEVRNLLKDPYYSSRLPIKKIKIHQPPAKENYIAWLGGSIFGATDVVTTRSIMREQYLKREYIPDWSDQMWTSHSGRGRS
ncbi:actin-related protein 10-like [Tachypleus tridentatus]|uniref:actin-related protein 10-like n=1 Tax=Tachypleus tridentatus TaxID=6853 RepID=UPI003FD3D332